MSAPRTASRFDPRWTRPERPALWVGVAVVVASWGLLVAAIVVALIAGQPYTTPGDFMLVYVGYALVWGGVAGIIIARGARLVGVVLAAQGIGAGLSALLTVTLHLPLSDPAVVGVLSHMADRPWLPGALASFAILPLLLDSRPLGPATRALVGLGLALSLVPFVLAPLRQRDGAPANPLAVADPVVQEAVLTAILVAFTLVVLLGVVSLGVVVWRRWFGPEEDRLGLGWIVAAQALLVVFASPMFLPAWPELAQAIDRVSPIAPLVAVLFMPAAVVVFALGRRIGGIDVTVNRAVVNVLLLAVLVLAYTAIATTAALLLPFPPLIAGVIGVAALALGIDPLRGWIQQRVDELVYGDAADPAQLVRSLGEQLDDAVDGDDLRSLVEALRRSLRLARLELRSAEPDGVVAIAGTGGGRATRIPLRASLDTVGWIAAAAPGRQRVDRRVVRVLDRISGVLAIALRLAEVNQELLEAVDRASDVAAEERRMVARELDEGLGPGLARSAERLSRIPALVAAGAEEAGAELRTVRAELAERTTEVRDLARTLLPGALDSGDLDAALRELAERFSSARLTIEVQGVLGDAIPAGREAAVHHLVAELVLLLRRSPDARRGVIELTSDARCARIAVRVDGVAREGDETAVLASVRDRVDELGGEFLTAEVEGERLLVVEVPR